MAPTAPAPPAAAGVKLSDGEEVGADVVVMAAGRQTRLPQVGARPGESFHGAWRAGCQGRPPAQRPEAAPRRRPAQPAGAPLQACLETGWERRTTWRPTWRPAQWLGGLTFAVPHAPRMD